MEYGEPYGFVYGKMGEFSQLKFFSFENVWL